MRPRKIILIIDTDPLPLSLLRLPLEVAGYRVLAAETKTGAINLFSTAPVDLVICDATRSLKDASETVLRLKQIARHIPMILLGWKNQLDQPHGADALLVKSSTPMSELLERVKVMSARKRGPRKGSHRIPPYGVNATEQQRAGCA
jgi:DNA-binding response OmpR family regulator